MFNCEKCGKTTEAGEAATKVTVASRTKSYRNQIQIKPKLDEDGNEEKVQRPRRPIRPQYLESTGTEIVKEITICVKCSGVVPVKAIERERKSTWWSPGLLPGIYL